MYRRNSIHNKLQSTCKTTSIVSTHSCSDYPTCTSCQSLIIFQFIRNVFSNTPCWLKIKKTSFKGCDHTFCRPHRPGTQQHTRQVLFLVPVSRFSKFWSASQWFYLDIVLGMEISLLNFNNMYNASKNFTVAYFVEMWYKPWETF